MRASSEPRRPPREAQGAPGRPAARGSQAWEARMEGGLLLGEIHPRLQPARLGEAGADGGPGDSRRLPCAGPGAAPRGSIFRAGFRGMRIPPALAAPSLCSGHLLGALSPPRDAPREPLQQASGASCAGNLGRRRGDGEGFASSAFARASLLQTRFPGHLLLCPGRACPCDPPCRGF